MRRSTRVWLEGLAQAFWSGIGGVFSVMVVDPGTFNFNELGMLAKVAGLAAAVSVVRYLAAKPAPAHEGDEARPIARIVQHMTGTGDGNGRGAE